MVGDDRARRLAEHVFQGQVDGVFPFLVLEDKLHVAGGFAYHVERSPFTLGDAAQQVDILFVGDQAHAFLALIADDFLGRQGRVAHGQGVHIDAATSGFDQFRQAVQMTAGPMVMDRDDGILIGFGHGADHIRYTLLHFRIGALYGVQLDGVGILSGLDRGDSAAAHADAVVVATHDDDLLAGLGLALQGILEEGAVLELPLLPVHDDLHCPPLLSGSMPCTLDTISSSLSWGHGTPLMTPVTISWIDPLVLMFSSSGMMYLVFTPMAAKSS